MFLRAVLLALVLAVAAAPASAIAAPKTPTAKVALGAKKPKKKAKKAKKVKKAKATKAKAKVTKPAAPARTTVVAPAAPVTCANTDLLPTADNLALIRDAVECLHNQTRAQNGLGTLAGNGALGSAALGHASDMVARGYFEHDTPEGGSFDQRILGTGYTRGANGWNLGENLAWASGELATPAALMRSWMESPGHRANILKPEFRELGLGLTYGTPTGTAGVTIAAEFGVRG